MAFSLYEAPLPSYRQILNAVGGLLVETTAHDILRWKGLPLGKRDFTGRVRITA